MAQDTAAPKKPRAHSLEARRPEIIEDLVFHLANPVEKIPQTELAEKFRITVDDIRNFLRRNKGRIDKLHDELVLGEWQNIGTHFKMLAYRAIKRAEEAMPKASAKDAALIAGLAVEKSILVENKGIRRVSVVHEHRHSVAGVLELLTNEMRARGISVPQDMKALPPAGDESENTDEP